MTTVGSGAAGRVSLGEPAVGRKSLVAKDFKTDQEVRWCPGCGDYAILAAVQGFLPQLGVPRENIVFISGIGCAARLPYYVNTYGMHSIHGRAPAIATGLAVTRPDLSVWVISGDGDALSIGGNHLIHALRRNVNLKILLFNNRIYGLTKGQYSPTSEIGKVTKSTPMGSLDTPFNPISVALGAEAGFVARTIDSDRAHLTEMLRQAAAHRGTALVEIYQNCNIFNDDAFAPLKDPATRDDATIRLRHGEPVTVGSGSRGVIREPSGRLAVVPLDPSGTPATGELLVHDAHQHDPSTAFALSRLSHPETLADTPDRRLQGRLATGIRRGHGAAGRRGAAPPGAGRSGRVVGRPGHLDGLSAAGHLRSEKHPGGDAVLANERSDRARGRHRRRSPFPDRPGLQGLTGRSPGRRPHGADGPGGARPGTRTGPVDPGRPDPGLRDARRRAGFNMARVVAVLLGLDEVPGTTVNRYCSSSVQSTRMAMHAIRAGEGHAFVSAGVETVSRSPLGSSDNPPVDAGADPRARDRNPWLNPAFARSRERSASRLDAGAPIWSDPRAGGLLPDVYLAMGQTAENVAQLCGVSRAEQDAFALRSQNLAEKAGAEGFWRREITPVTLPDGTVVSADDCPRAGTTAEGLGALKPVFRRDGTITAGNACPLNDGAAALVVLSADRAARTRPDPPGADRLAPRVSALSRRRSWGSDRSRRRRRALANWRGCPSPTWTWSRSTRRSRRRSSRAYRQLGRRPGAGQRPRRGDRGRAPVRDDRRPDRDHAAQRPASTATRRSSAWRPCASAAARAWR